MSAAVKVARATYRGDPRARHPRYRSRYAGDPGLLDFFTEPVKKIGGFVSKLNIPIVSSAAGAAAGIARAIDPDTNVGQTTVGGASGERIPAGASAGGVSYSRPGGTGGGFGGSFNVGGPSGLTVEGGFGRGGSGYGRVETTPGEILEMGQAVAQQTGGQMTIDANGKMCGCKGRHLNKTSYFLKDGTFVPAGTRWVKNRRRFDPGNTRATRRAIGRIRSAKALKDALAGVTVRDRC
jgi:hypothetical protein